MSSTATEAREQTPTLMAGEAAGSQGAVQVWAPERWRLWLWAAAQVLVVVMVLWLIVHDYLGKGDLPGAILDALLGVYCIISSGAAAYAVLRRPCYLTTDNAGIGIRMAGGGTRSLRWEDIDILQRKGVTLTLTYRRSPYKTALFLTGYPERDRKRIEALIIKQARLTRNPFNRLMCYRTPTDPRKPPLSAPSEPEKALKSGD